MWSARPSMKPRLNYIQGKLVRLCTYRRFYGSALLKVEVRSRRFSYKLRFIFKQSVDNKSILTKNQIFAYFCWTIGAIPEGFNSTRCIRQFCS